MKSTYRKIAKRTLLFILLVHFAGLSFAATYYVSNAGNDTNSGLTEALAWKTLAKVNAATFVAGDNILFKKGDSFYGSLTIKNSGAAGKPITFGAYGVGANPIVTGFTTVASWINLGNNIWESASAASSFSDINILSVDGINTPKGRYPNADAVWGGYLNIDATSGNGNITNNSFNGTPNWTGAQIVIRTNNYKIEKKVISSQSGGTISFSNTSFIPEINQIGRAHV